MMNPDHNKPSVVVDEWLNVLADLEREDDTRAQGGLNGQRFLEKFDDLWPPLGDGAAWVLYRCGVALHKLGTMWEAARFGQTALGLPPETLPSPPVQGVDRPQDCLIRAERYFQASILAKENFASPHFNLARLGDGRGEVAEAVANYERAADLDGYYRPHANLRIGLLLVSSDRPARAHRYLLAAANADVVFGELHVELARALRRVGDVETSIREYGKTIHCHHYFAPEFTLRPPAKDLGVMLPETRR